MTLKKYYSAALTLVMLTTITAASAQKNRTFTITSPDKRTQIRVTSGEVMQWSVSYDGKTVLAPSELSMKLTDRVLGHNVKVTGNRTERVNTVINTSLYKKAVVKDNYEQLTIQCAGDYDVIFRAYDEGVAYRFATRQKAPLTVVSETSSYAFGGDHQLYLPYIDPFKGRDKYHNSFENMYTHTSLSSVIKDSLAFLPLMVELPEGIKVVLTEADLENYPGMYIKKGDAPNSLTANFAPYPDSVVRGGYSKVEMIIKRRKNFIATTDGTRLFPWRVLAIADQDKKLLDNDLVFKLARKSRIADPSWIRPGKVAWDWWNDWNISHVDFRAGINTATYKYYIDFAAKNHIEYVLLDDGWSEKTDIMKVVPTVDLQELVNYGRQKNVGLWLWAGMMPINEKMDEAFDHYAAMGIKGFKIDFMDRDDQEMVKFNYKAAEKAAQRKLMIDLHGTFKPTGLQRTYPNVVNVEGVYGMENLKVNTKSKNFPQYETIIPYVRMLAGPLDYTPGAMRNTTRTQFQSSYSMPASEGTRCHQLAMYVVYESPLSMLSDNPTSYLKEQECTDMISSIPTTFDETIPLAGKVGDHAVIARRKGNEWFISALNNWDEKDLELDLSPLGKGKYKIVIFQDGINVDRDATDYKKVTAELDGLNHIKLHLAPGGGWVAHLIKQ